MKILFCDLCNESVPQSELDAGRAFMRKGRVVCLKCDQLMTQREESSDANPFGGPTSQPASPSVPPQASLTPLPVASLAQDAAFPTVQPQPAHSHASAQPGQRFGSGVALALFSIGLTACGYYWLMERSERVSTELQKRLDSIQQEQEAADSRAGTRSTELKGELLALQGRLDSRADDERKALEIRFAELQTKYELSLISLGDLRESIESLQGVAPSLQRHDEELNSGAQKLVTLESRANAIEVALTELKKELEKRAGPAEGAARPSPATPVGTPPWMGLVQQLESANSGDRWVAVQGLGETRDPAVAEYILPRLKDVDIFVRMAAARVLGDLGSPKASGALIEALGDQDQTVREAAYLALCSVSKKALPFDPHADAVERAKRVKAWQDWWKKAQDESGAQ